MSCRAALILSLVLPLAGCGQLMRYAGDATANLITQKTADLKDVAAQASFTTNLYANAAGTIETEGLEAWKAGGTMIGVNFLKRSGVGMWEIDGTVTARKGKDAPVPLTYWGKGAYGLILAPGDRTPRLIEVRTASGQTASFTVKPAAPVKIKAVNGKPAGAAVDTRKDLVIDLEDAGATAGGGKLKVAMIGSTMGVRTFMDLAVCKPAKRIVVPAAAFRHLGISASMENFLGVDMGANYVLVERYEQPPVAHGAIGAVMALGRSWSSVPVTASGDVRNATGLSASGETATPNGPVTWTITKPAAFYGPAVAKLKKPVIGQLAVRAKLYKQDVSTSQSGNIITTTTTTYKFPAVAPASWDRLMDDATADLAASAGGPNNRLPLVPTERLIATSGYKALETVKEQQTAEYVERTYRGGRNVFPESFAGILGSVSSTFAPDRPIVRMMGEAGADGVLTARINLQIGAYKDTKKLALVPGMSVMIIGPANGYTVGPTSYYTATIQAKDGVTFTAEELEDVGALRRVARLDDLAAGLRGAVAKLREEEKKAGYDAIWALQ